MSTIKEIGLFKRDRIIRNKSGKPLGRIILAKEYIPETKIAITLMEIPRSFTDNPQTEIFYIDELPYKIQEDLHPIRIRKTKLKYLVNNFYLNPV